LHIIRRRLPTEQLTSVITTNQAPTIRAEGKGGYGAPMAG
jgi:hypothetical protein